MQIPETRYAKTVDGVHIAFQVFGDGPIDVLFHWGELSNVDRSWEMPEMSSLMERLASFSRVMFFDRRGNGLSDHDLAGSAFEAGMDDVRAVMDASGSERAVLFGFGDGGMLCTLFAASYPERTAGLVLFNTPARMLKAPDYPSAWTEEEWDEYLARIDGGWGTLAFAEEQWRWIVPSYPLDEEGVVRFARLMRAAGSPGDIVRLDRVIREADVRAVLPSIHVPTLVIVTSENRVEPADGIRYLAGQIPGAKLVELPLDEYTLLRDAQEPVLDEVERFVRRIHDEDVQFDRVLATVLFTDIVDSTAQSAAMGDRAWAEIRDRHDQLVRSNLSRFRGREIKTMGDGFLATFDGPARGVRCAEAITSGVKSLGIEIRAGLHTGEVALDGDDVAGLGVAIGARVGALAGASEVLVSQTVKDLVAGSGLAFEDVGEHELKGVPDRWRLYRVVDPAP